MRLDKLLGRAGYGSRNQVKKLIRSQQVVIDGEVATRDNLNVDVSLQDITVSGQKLSHSPQKYFLLNKPSGYVTAIRDSQHPTVMDCLVPEDRIEGLYPLGRLDRDTEGLLLLTNNGPLGYRMLHPRHHVTKTYYVEVNAALEDDAKAFFDNGIAFHDGTICKPADLEIISSSPSLSSAHITISEGKFHQVKKMFLAYGVKVTYLKRIAFGQLSLGDLAIGDYRELTEIEKNYLKAYLD